MSPCKCVASHVHVRRACGRVAHCGLDPLLALAEDPGVDPECASHTDVLLANLGRDAETRNLIHVRRLQLDNARADLVCLGRSRVLNALQLF